MRTFNKLAIVSVLLAGCGSSDSIIPTTVDAGEDVVEISSSTETMEHNSSKSPKIIISTETKTETGTVVATNTINTTATVFSVVYFGATSTSTVVATSTDTVVETSTATITSTDIVDGGTVVITSTSTEVVDAGSDCQQQFQCCLAQCVGNCPEHCQSNCQDQLQQCKGQTGCQH
jgi:hypothetical protein